jgi:hypothetical protein
LARAHKGCNAPAAFAGKSALSAAKRSITGGKGAGLIKGATGFAIIGTATTAGGFAATTAGFTVLCNQ